MSDVKAFESTSPPFHGGRLHHAAQQYDIPVDDWIDLSTGINPHSYPLPAVPQNVWQKLPDEGDHLLSIAATYYGASDLLAVAGSQAAIEQLPGLRAAIKPGSRVAILSPAYAEYAYHWQRHGHEVEELTAAEIEAQLNTELDAQLQEPLPYLDVVIVIRPNNPTTEFLSHTRLQRWLALLQQNNGWLIIDEAFIDALPDNQAQSMITKVPLCGLIVLRSVGKFFGLAGIRLGFVWAESALLAALAARLGTWSVSSVTRWAGGIALQDGHWQVQIRQRLTHDSHRLSGLLAQYGLSCVSTPLFSSIFFSPINNTHIANTKYIDQRNVPAGVYRHLSERGILIRYFEQLPALRFGLPGNEMAWQRLEKALSELKQ
ncbi:threonine-phosphate decarboxylase CobD [Neptunomonas antarctica]|uniref:threonine-phosphate decarboxylase n=1 Tax=Neptunomonas antarctica TaxID=619304 RepID=A0A1N7NEX7_9GAMM|nr:threonine-phosphate decarboxylase CobD [Neptunomonas antarctica]SIS96811.1 L-threonine O-3-phosphate decarboxylase [Neptunomonas antarctica]